jgi:hypothetical protein
VISARCRGEVGSLTAGGRHAAVDRRVGEKRLKGSLDTWDDVQGAFDYWAERLRVRLAELRGAGTK